MVNNITEVETLNSQKRIWLLSQFEKGSSAYNNFVVYSIQGDLFVKKFEQSIHKMVDKHPALRSRFKLTANGLRQYIEEKQEDRSYYTYSKYENSISISSILKKEFDLYSGPLFSIFLFKKTTSEYLFFLCFHHIISDGISINFLVKDIISDYIDVGNNTNSIYDEDYIVYHEDAQTITITKAEQDFWQHHLKGWEGASSSIIYDYPANSKKSFQGERITFRISKEDTKKIKQQALKSKTTLYCLLFSIYLVFLHKILNSEQIICGTILSGRNKLNNNFFGMFVNTLPYHFTLNDDQTFDQVVSSTTQKIFNFYKFQNMPFDEILKLTGAEKERSKNPLFESAFLLQETPFEFKDENIQFTFLPEDKKTSIFDVLLQVYQNNGELCYSWEYDNTLLSRESMEYYTCVFENLFKTVVDNPTISLKEIRLK